MKSSLYHEDIKTLAKKERAPTELAQPDCTIILDNPLCGDRVTLALQLAGDQVIAEAHEVKGCLLCRAAANALGDSVVGHSAGQLTQVTEALRAFLKGEAGGDWPFPGWQSLQVFQPVIEHKSRHDCVLLPFKALNKALQQA